MERGKHGKRWRRIKFIITDSYFCRAQKYLQRGSNWNAASNKYVTEMENVNNVGAASAVSAVERVATKVSKICVIS